MSRPEYEKWVVPLRTRTPGEVHQWPRIGMQQSSTEQMLSGIPIKEFVASRVHAALDVPSKMRRFVWYYRDEPTEGLLCSNGHVVQDMCNWGKLYHYPSWEAFLAACTPEHVVWIDPEVQGGQPS